MTTYPLLTTSLLLLLLSPFATHPANASGQEPAPYFLPPTYVDTEYKNLFSEYSAYWYRPRDMYMNLFYPDYSPYETPEESPNQAQIDARNRAKDTETYKLYEAATDAFYKRNYEKALADYINLTSKRPPLTTRIKAWFGTDTPPDWSIEAATYMIGRTRMVMAQQKWDGYNDPLESVDQNLIEAARESYMAYLESYPHGLFAESARNIQRRLYALSGKKQALSDEIRKTLRETKTYPSPFLLRELVRFDTGTPVDLTKDAPPVILYAWLESPSITEQDLEKLEHRKNDFALYPHLYDLTLALGLYQSGQYQSLIEKIPSPTFNAATDTIGTIQTIHLLRARSFAKLQRYEDALKSLTDMHADTVSVEQRFGTTDIQSIELEIGRIKLAEHDPMGLFTHASPLQDPIVIRAFIQNLLDDQDLEKALNDPAIDLTAENRIRMNQELMLRYLLDQQFAKLDTLYKRVPTDIPETFKKTIPVVARLAKNPQDLDALLEIAHLGYAEMISPQYTFNENQYFVYYNYSALTEMIPWCGEYCKNAQHRINSYSPPYVLFKKIADTYRTKALPKSETEAKALHFMVTCFRGEIFQIQCKWEKDFENEGQTYFKRLHKRYPKSEWTKNTPYYY